METGFDFVVIGGGPGGYTAAIRAAQLGLKTALVENRQLGGTCLNRGCIPTKTLLHTAEVVRQAKDFENIGVVCAGLGCDLQKLYSRKNQVVEQLRQGVEGLLKGNGVQVFSGTGCITSSGKVTVDFEGEEKQELSAKNILVATGSVPGVPPIPGADLSGVLTSDSLLEALPQEMKSLLIIGGGVIGVEFATIFSSFGCEVTIIELADRLLPGMDKEISQNLSMILKKRGVGIRTGAKVAQITRNDGQLCCTYQDKGGEQQVQGDYILIATGRKANISGLFLQGMEPAMERGYIAVDDKLMTSLPGIYAIGDVRGGVQLAHAAAAQGTAVAEYLAGHTPVLRLDVVPSCVYTDPEIACVGLTAEEAKEQGIETVTGKFLMTANGKSLIEGLERGFIKVVMDAQSHVILGAQLMCGRATDLVAEFTVAVAAGLTKEQMAQAIHPHPTFCEGVGECIELLDGNSIHTMPKRR